MRRREVTPLQYWYISPLNFIGSSFQYIAIMERLFEANKLVELSVTKLNRTSELPLRRSLLVNKVMNRAKEVASTSEQFMDFADSNNDLRSSRLFATMSASRVDEPRPSSRPQSPFTTTIRREVVTDNKLAVCRRDPQQTWPDIDRMETDITTHNPVLSEILSPEKDSSISWDEEVKQLDWCEQPEITSPGKRKCSDRYTTWSSEDSVFSFDDHKRFKQAPQLFDSTWCSSPNISTTPFIAYMFTGFTSPAHSLASLDWPDYDHFTSSLTYAADHGMPRQPILAY